jgi:lipopolysaccharide export system protein LptC
MKKKKYIVDGQLYEIPDDVQGDFLKDNPHAKAVYNVEGTEYHIPHDEADAFETDMGLKKKVETSSVALSENAQNTSQDSQIGSTPSNRNINPSIEGTDLGRIPEGVPGATAANTIMDLYHSAKSALTDMLPGGIASGEAGMIDSKNSFENQIANNAYPGVPTPQGLIRPEVTEEMRKAAIENYKKKVGEAEFEKQKKEVTSRLEKRKKDLLAYSDQQDLEGQQEKKGITQSTRDIKDLPTALSWIAGSVGNVAGLAPAMVVPIFPYLLEKGEAYKGGLSEIEKTTGKSRDQIIAEDLDKAARDNSDISGAINTALEAVGTLSVFGKFIPKGQAIKLITKILSTKIGALTVAAIGEGGTEAIQALDNKLAEKMSTGQFKDVFDAANALTPDDIEEIKQEGFAGAVGGGVLGLVGKSNKPEQSINAPTTDLGVQQPSQNNEKAKPTAPPAGEGQAAVPEVVPPHTDRINRTAAEVDAKFGKIETPELDKNKNEAAGVQEEADKAIAEIEGNKNKEINGGSDINTGNGVRDTTGTGSVGNETGEAVQTEASAPAQQENKGGVQSGNKAIRGAESEATSPVLTETTKKSNNENSTQNEEVRKLENGQGLQDEGKQPSGQENGSQADEEKVSGIKKALVPDGKTVDFEKVTDKEMFDLGKQEVASGNINPTKLVSEINQSPRALQPLEVTALVYHKAQLDNSLIEALNQFEEASTEDQKQRAQLKIDSISSDIDAYHEAALHTARQQSLAFRLRQSLSDSEYNLVTEIQQYKKENKGVISDEVLAKFKEYDQQLKDANKKILQLESKQRDKSTVDKFKDIAAFERKRKTAQVSKEQRKKIEDAFEKVKAKILAGKMTGTLNSAVPLLTVENLAKALDVVKRAVLAGYDVSQAIKKGIDSLKSQKIVFDEKQFEDEMRMLLEAELPSESIDSKIHIPKNMLLSMVENGVTDINELTKRIHNVALAKNPSITEREVRDAITNYGEKRGVTKNETLSALNKLKRLGRIISKIEDVKKGKLPFKNTGTSQNKSLEEKQLEKELKNLIADNVDVHPEFKNMELDKLKSSVKKVIADYEKRLAEKQFVRDKPRSKPVDAELTELYRQKEAAKEGFEAAKESAKLKNRTPAKKLADDILTGINLPKALVFSLDLSAPLRQGAYFISHPKQFYKSVGSMISQMASKKNYDAYLATVKNSDQWPMIKAVKLALTQQDGKVSAHEELFANRLTKKIPWVSVSERAYSGFLNSIRINVFLEGAAELERAGITYQSNPEEYKRLAEHINTGTGRANLGTKGENASQLLNTIFLSPRFVYSRLKIATGNNRFVFDPATYKYNPFTKEGEARGKVNQMILADQAKFVGTIAMLLFMSSFAAKLAGGDDDENGKIEWNPFSSNFAKVRIGDYWYDRTGGVGRMLSYVFQLTFGIKQTEKGLKDSNRLDNFLTGPEMHDSKTREKFHGNSFIRSKLSPVTSMAVSAADNAYDLSGKKMKLIKFNDHYYYPEGGVLMDYFTPLIFKEAVAAKENIDKHPEKSYTEAIQPVVESLLGTSVNVAY